MKGKGIRLSVVVLAISLSLIFSAAGPAAAEGAKIGVMLATTGRYAAMGEGEKLGAVLAIRKINASGGIGGKKLEMVFEDDEGDPGKGSTAVRKLISVDKVIGIFGSTSNVVSHAVSLITEEMKVPILSPAPSPKLTEGKRFTFQNVGVEQLLVDKVGEYFCEVKKWKQVGILHDESEYGMDLAKGIDEWCKPKGIKVVKAKFSPRASDVSPQCLIMKNEGVQGVFLVGGAPTAPAIALKNMKQLGIAIPVLASPSLNNDRFISLAGDACEGIDMVSYFHYGKWTKGEKELIDFMSKEVPNVFPTLFHALGWDGINLFARAIKKAGTDPVKIRDEVEKITNYQGAVGDYNFGPNVHNGLGPDTLTFVKVVKGKFVYLDTK
ncbi:MAG: ABC transporter substrate-binding protein [Thermodesulfobacteriota bacterium]